jgi:uncharacterized membrane protein required for colicin V production
MADLLFAIILFYGFVLGMRRGFYKEVVGFIALIVAISVARTTRVPAGQLIATKTGAPLLAAEVVAVVVVWVVVFFVVAVIGRLLLKKLRGKGVDDALEDGAEELADAIAGDTTKGPMTLLTDPIASKRGLFYWSDKLLGLLLGGAKGIITGYAFFGVIIYADRLGYESRLARSVESSFAGAIFKKELEPLLATFPEYKIAAKVAEMRDIANLVQEDPARRFDVFASHPELGALARDPQVQKLAQDPEIREKWMKRDLKGLLLDRRVHGLVTDPAVREKVAAVDWAKVRDAVSRVAASPPPATTTEGPR